MRLLLSFGWNLVSTSQRKGLLNPDSLSVYLFGVQLVQHAVSSVSKAPFSLDVRKVCLSCLLSALFVFLKTRTCPFPGRMKTCLNTEFFIFREVPPNLKNEAKNVMISVERHGEMRQGIRAGSSFDPQEKTTEVSFPRIFFATLSSEISFSFSPTIVTCTRALNFRFQIFKKNSSQKQTAVILTIFYRNMALEFEKLSDEDLASHRAKIISIIQEFQFLKNNEAVILLVLVGLCW